MSDMTRRQLVLGAAASAALAGQAGSTWFTHRSLAIVPTEAAALGLPERAADWGINVLDLGHYSEWLAGSDEGRSLVEACRERRVGFEFSLHVCAWFLPRDLFGKNPGMFRMNDAGERTPDANLCVSSREAVDLFCANAVKHADLLRPSTHRYHYWIDDGQPMCRCPRCRDLSDSDQALQLENQLLAALRQGDPKAEVAHLAYQRTAPAPAAVKPARGIYLEFAPIERDTLKPLTASHPAHARALHDLDANLAVFGARSAEVLEYWLDNSRYSGWDRAKIGKLPWSAEPFEADVRTYALRGIRRMRTYAYWFDADYVRKWGSPPIGDYAAELLRWRAARGKPVRQAAR